MVEPYPKSDLKPLSKALLDKLRATYGENEFTSVVNKAGNKRYGPWRVYFWGKDALGRSRRRAANWSCMQALERRRLVYWKGKDRFGRNIWTLVKPALPLDRKSSAQRVDRRLRRLLRDMPGDL